MGLHSLLFFGERDSHFFQRHPVERPGHFQSFRCLILLQAGACLGIKLARLLARIEAPLFDDRLCLFDLVSSGAEDRLAS